MKFCLKLLTLLFITIQCGKKDGAQPPSKDPVGAVVTETPLAWGMLPCQTQKTCENKILNVSEQEWVHFLLFVFKFKDESGIEAATNTDQKMFVCGSLFVELIDKHLPYLVNEQPVDLTRFALHVIDPVACRVRQDFIPQLDLYLNLNRP